MATEGQLGAGRFTARNHTQFSIGSLPDCGSGKQEWHPGDCWGGCCSHQARDLYPMKVQTELGGLGWGLGTLPSPGLEVFGPSENDVISS